MTFPGVRFGSAAADVHGDLDAGGRDASGLAFFTVQSFLLTKYRVSGTWRWAKQLSGEAPTPPVGLYWHANALAFGDAARVFVGGGSQDAMSGYSGDAYLHKRHPDSGSTLWHAPT